MQRYYRFYKPFGYLSQFTDEGNKQGLSHLLDLPKDVYGVGRLDADSEGLLLLTNDTAVNRLLLSPKHAHTRSYLVQVEGTIDAASISKLEQPMELRFKKKVYTTLPAKATAIDAPQGIPDRDPPIRYRASIPTSWIELQLTEGKNRQVRKMTAHVGFPTLRLIRNSVEDITLEGLKPGDYEEILQQDFYRQLHL